MNIFFPHICCLEQFFYLLPYEMHTSFYIVPKETEKSKKYPFESVRNNLLGNPYIYAPLMIIVSLCYVCCKRTGIVMMCENNISKMKHLHQSTNDSLSKQC